MNVHRGRPLQILLLATVVASLLAACRPVQLAISLINAIDVSTVDAPSPPVGTAAFPTPTPTPVTLILPPVVAQPPTPTSLPTLPAPTPTPEVIAGPITVALHESVPMQWGATLLARLNQVDHVESASGVHALHVLDQPTTAQVLLDVRPYVAANAPLAERIFAVVMPFATIRDDVSFDEVRAAWQGMEGAATLYTTIESAALLRPVLGAFVGVLTPQSELLAAIENDPGALAILPFDQLDPRFKVMSVDGVNVLSNRFDMRSYPLAVALNIEGTGAGAVRSLLQNSILPYTNRNGARLTQLIMTGVTAMSRVTALRMDQKGYDYPSRVISDVFAAADITHISNEVPFLDDCIADPTENNLILCSHPNYWAALEALGVDIVGLSGNHVNDFGREGARRSLNWYRENGIPIYGGGFNVNEACAPLLWEDHGNTFAFIAALAFWPQGAWATIDQPGACYYYDNEEIILAMVRQLSEIVDIVSVELQYEESYQPNPLVGQIVEFRKLREAGADIVTGVQSHVPQAQEPYGVGDPGGPGIISYGLGNFFFDQMWSWETRTELAARHTIYNGRLLSTELLTMVLEDFAQPRWATTEERADILNRVFLAAPPR